MALPIRDDDDDPFEDEEARKEAQLLAKLRVGKFTVNPDTIRPFEVATLAWDVFVPPDVASQIPVSILVAGQVVPAAGTRTVSPLNTGAFLLEAKSTTAKRILGHKVVNVDVTGCQHDDVPIRTLQALAREAKDLLRGAGNLTQRGEVSISARPPDGLLIEAPLSARIPNFFDADIDVDVLFGLSAVSKPDGSRVVAAKVRSVSVDVIFHLAEHIFSGGSATAAQAIIQPMAAELIRSYVGPVLEQDVARQLQVAVDVKLAEFQRRDDPQHRVHKLYSIATDSGAGLNAPGFLQVVGCAVPPPPPPPPVIKAPRPVARRSRRGSSR